MTQDMITEIVVLILTLILGGGLMSGWKSYQEAQATKAAASAAGVKAPVEIESMRVASLDIVLKNLQEENELVRKDRDYWKEMYKQVKAEIDSLVKEMDEYRGRVADLQKALDVAASHAPSASDD